MKNLKFQIRDNKKRNRNVLGYIYKKYEIFDVTNDNPIIQFDSICPPIEMYQWMKYLNGIKQIDLKLFLDYKPLLKLFYSFRQLEIMFIHRKLKKKNEKEKFYPSNGNHRQ